MTASEFILFTSFFFSVMEIVLCFLNHFMSLPYLSFEFLDCHHLHFDLYSSFRVIDINFKAESYQS